MDYAREYRRKTPTSARLFAKSARLHINGVSHNIRFYRPYPFVVRESKGKNLVDVDSNMYTDYWMGHWALILGHGPSNVRRSLQAQIRKSWMYGTVNEQTIALSDLISKAVPVAEKIRYVASGTESIMYAVRLARSVSGRRIIAKVDGGWHGYTSDLLKAVNWPFSEPESTGMVNEDQVISIPYNDLEGSVAILKKHAKDLAGVVIEPVLGGGGGIPADEDYLRGVQEFCRENDSLFILDEIVTGFRFRFGCLYPAMKLDPDIVTLGKIVGGGLAIGAMCGKKEVMETANISGKKKSERSFVGGGTFSANPASMVAGHATLDHLRSNRSIYSRINGLGEFARREIGKAFDGRVAMTGTGSLFMTHFLRDGMTEVVNSEQAARCDTEQLERYHFKMIAHDGIFFLPGKLGAVSDAHSKADIKRIVRASAEFTG